MPDDSVSETSPSTSRTDRIGIGRRTSRTVRERTDGDRRVVRDDCPDQRICRRRQPDAGQVRQRSRSGPCATRGRCPTPPTPSRLGAAGRSGARLRRSRRACEGNRGRSSPPRRSERDASRRLPSVASNARRLEPASGSRAARTRAATPGGTPLHLDRARSRTSTSPARRVETEPRGAASRTPTSTDANGRQPCGEARTAEAGRRPSGRAQPQVP